MTQPGQQFALLGAINAFLFIVILLSAGYVNSGSLSTTVFVPETPTPTPNEIAQNPRPSYRPCPRGPFRPPTGEEPEDATQPCPEETPLGTPTQPAPPPPAPQPPTPTETPAARPLVLTVTSPITLNAGETQRHLVSVSDPDGQPLQLRLWPVRTFPDARTFCNLEGVSALCTTQECREPTLQ